MGTDVGRRGRGGTHATMRAQTTAATGDNDNGHDGNGHDGNGHGGNGHDGNGPHGNGPHGSCDDGDSHDGDSHDGDGHDGDSHDGDGAGRDGGDGLLQPRWVRDTGESCDWSEALVTAAIGARHRWQPRIRAKHCREVLRW